MKWTRYYADVVPSKGLIRIKKQVWDSNNSKGLFKKKNLVVTTVKEVPLPEKIPIEEVEIEVEHFDNTAFQSDDRFFTTTQKVKRYNPDAMKIAAEKALAGYNTTPQLIYHI